MVRVLCSELVLMVHVLSVLVLTGNRIKVQNAVQEFS